MGLARRFFSKIEEVVEVFTKPLHFCTEQTDVVTRAKDKYAVGMTTHIFSNRVNVLVGPDCINVMAIDLIVIIPNFDSEPLSWSGAVTTFKDGVDIPAVHVAHASVAYT